MFKRLKKALVSDATEFWHMYHFEPYENRNKWQENRNKWQENRNKWQVDRDELSRDYVVEVTLRGKKVTGYKLCKISRWYDPDCVPGIISFLVGQDSSYSTGLWGILFTEDQYIDLPGLNPVPSHRLDICTKHFTERGFDYLDDSREFLPTGNYYTEHNEWLDNGYSARQTISYSSNRHNGGVIGDTPKNPGGHTIIDSSAYRSFLDHNPSSSTWSYHHTRKICAEGP
jgi:hypothetical protein